MGRALGSSIYNLEPHGGAIALAELGLVYAKDSWSCVLAKQYTPS